MKKHIPNLITLGNLTCGVIACLMASQGFLWQAAVYIIAGIFFDFFDGLAARLLKVSSDIGKELDSLADVVTSGVAPALILFMVLGMPSYANDTNDYISLFSYAALLMPAFAAYRLAKFNLDEEQHHSFKGLPVPANALVWVGLALAFPDMQEIAVDAIWKLWWIPALVVLSLVMDILMVSRMPMFSLKFNFKDLSWKTNSVQYVFLIGCAIIAVLAFCLDPLCQSAAHPRWLAISVCILWYIVLSAITQKKKPKENK